MRAGSVVLYTGSVYHGGGANTTADQTRIGVNITYNRGWLRQEENQYLAVSRECAATLDEDLLRLMGYQKGALRARLHRRPARPDLGGAPRVRERVRLRRVVVVTGRLPPFCEPSGPPNNPDPPQNMRV